MNSVLEIPRAVSSAAPALSDKSVAAPQKPKPQGGQNTPFQRQRTPLKWMGGKYDDLPQIAAALPAAPVRAFIDPFVGGGSVAYNMEAMLKDRPERYVLSDADSDLIRFMSLGDAEVQELLRLLGTVEAARVAARKNTDLTRANFSHRFFQNASKCILALSPALRNNSEVQRIVLEERNRREQAMLRIEKRARLEKRKKSDLGLDAYARTGLLAAIYYIVRNVYNTTLASSSEASPKANSVISTAMWFVLRELSCGGVTRYSKQSRFNTPYGGGSYDGKSLVSKAPGIQSYILDFLRDASVSVTEADVIDQLNRVAPGPDDFLFLDPPYDQNFSDDVGTTRRPFDPYKTTARRERVSTHQDLFDWLLAEGHKTRWMLIERQTPWIDEQIKRLKAGPDKKTISVSFYDRRYSANMKNRNVREAVHVVVTNYKRTPG